MTESLSDDLQRTLGDVYTVERELSGGGMSRVFVVEDKRLHRQIAVKVLATLQGVALNAERFEREIQLAAGLQHPHIVPVIAAGDVNGIPYYTMPFVRGESLRSRMTSGRVPRAEATKILSDVAAALGYAHSEGVVHRDIKPENILLSSGSAVVSDFGIAKAVNASRTPDGGELTLTAHGTSMGSPAYMAPEQAAGDTVDARADIYSWGIIAYELLTGAHPFADRRSAQQLIVAQITVMPKSLAEVRDIPPGLAALVMQCLEKDAAKRPSSAGDLVHGLDLASSGPIATSLRPSHSRSRSILIAAGTVAALVAIAFVAWSTRAKSAVAAVAPAVMVIPFQNLSGDTASEYFSDGMTEELVGMLERSGALRVASRSTTFLYKGKHEDPQLIGRERHVDAVLTGSVRRAADRLRIAAELVRTSDGQPIWSETYDRSPKDVFGIQEEISRAIATSMKVTLAPHANTQARSTDLAAYDYYLQALKEARNPRSRAREERRIALLTKSVVRDSSFAPAWAQLSQTYLGMAEYVKPLTVLPRAKEAAQRAVKLDPTNAEVAVAMADITFNYDWDWVAAEREYKRAISLDPRSVEAKRRYAEMLWAERRTREAFDLTKKANALAWDEATDTTGLRATAERHLAWVYASEGNHAAAKEHLAIALRAAPKSWAIHYSAGLTLKEIGEHQAALDELRIAERLTGDKRLPLFAQVGMAYGLVGQTDSAKARLKALIARSSSEYVPKDQIAVLYESIGDRKASLRTFEQAINERHYWLPYTNGSSYANRMRHDPEFRRLMRRLNVPEYAL